MNTKITVFTQVVENADSPITQYVVKVNDAPAYTPFGHIYEAKAAAFNEACKASLDGPVTCEEVAV